MGGAGWPLLLPPHAPGAVVHGLQRALRRVPALERKAVRAALEVEGDEIGGERLVGRVDFGLAATAIEHARLKVRLARRERPTPIAAPPPPWEPRDIA